MCDPVTLTLASAGVAMIGQGVSAYSSYQQHGYEAKVATQNARQANESALDAIERGKIEDRRHQIQVGRQMGAQRASMAANGIDLDYGNAADVVGDTATFGQEDSLTIRENAMREAHGFEINAANFVSEAKSQKRQATGALISGAFKMTETALSAASQYSKLKAK